MHLQDIFDQLVYGELAQTNIGMPLSADMSGGVQPNQYPAMAMYINGVLVDIYRSFNLRTKEVFLQQYEGVTVYHINSKYAVSNLASDAPIKYVVDSPEFPFEDDLLKITKVFDEAECEIVMNDEKDDYAIYELALDKLQIPYPDSNKSLSVIYRAKHPKIPADFSDPTLVEVELPEVFLSLLAVGVAARYYAAMPTMAEKGKSQEFFEKYRILKSELSDDGINITEEPTNEKACDNGWA